MQSSIADNLNWLDRPPAASWDAALGLCLAHSRGLDQLVPLGELLARIGQGVVVASLDQGDIGVDAIRVGDIQPLLMGAGERRFVSSAVLRRHVVGPGDVLIARVGRHGRASCVPAMSAPVVPREGLFVAKPHRPEWGPVLAAALSTTFVRAWLDQLSVASRTGALTADQISEIPIPAPGRFDYGPVIEAAAEAATLANDGRTVLDRVRGEIAMLLENAPVGPLGQRCAWITELESLVGWGWQDVERARLRALASWRVRGLQPLADLVDVRGHRAETATPGGSPFVLDAAAMRPEWYLALPMLPMVQGDDASGSTLAPRGRGQGEGSSTAVRRFFAVSRECLLIPTVGDIAGTPVVVPAVVVKGMTCPLLVPIHWLPLEGLPYPRALAVVLDHPFVRLQRRLAGSVSTVTHITREDIESLLVPSPPEAIWQSWEAEMRRAQEMFMGAAELVSQAVKTVEEWYK